jgi:hypothetical protein
MTFTLAARLSSCGDLIERRAIAAPDLDPAAGEKFVNIILVANVGLKGLAGHDEEVGRIGFADGARRAPYVLAAPKNGTAAGMAIGALNRLLASARPPSLGAMHARRRRDD